MGTHDAELWLMAEGIVRKAKGRHRTKVRGVLRDNAKVTEKVIDGVVVKVPATQTTPPTPGLFLFNKDLEETFSNRYSLEVRQVMARIKQLTPSRRKTLFMYLGVLFSEWTGVWVRVGEGLTHTRQRTQNKTIHFDVRFTK